MVMCKNKIFDKKLINRNKNVIRIEDYKGSKTKIMFKCKKCLYEWKTRPDMILLSHHGCPSCNNNLPLTNIEYNGIQHYEPVGIFGGDEAFHKQIKRDKEIESYCSLNNINLIVLKYDMSDQEIKDFIVKTFT